MSDKNIVSFSSQIDLELAENLRKKGCPHCGGVLHFARYERVNKNLSTESKEPSHNKFHSLCCSVEGCRKRARPLSIRYAGRSPFSMALFLLVELIKSRGSKRSVIALRKELQISERTIHRWLAFWKKVYTQSIWWRKVSSIWMLSGRTVKELWPLLISRWSEIDLLKKMHIALFKFPIFIFMQLDLLINNA